MGGGRLAGAHRAGQELGRSVSTQGFHYVYRWAERETHVYLYRWAHLSWLRAARAWELSPSHSTPVPTSCFLNILPPEGDWTAACPQRCPKGGWEWVCGKAGGCAQAGTGGRRWRGGGYRWASCGSGPEVEEDRPSPTLVLALSRSSSRSSSYSGSGSSRSRSSSYSSYSSRSSRHSSFSGSRSRYVPGRRLRTPGACTVAGLCLDGVLPGARLCSKVTAEQECVERCRITSRRHWGLGVHGARVGSWSEAALRAVGVRKSEVRPLATSCGPALSTGPLATRGDSHSHSVEMLKCAWACLECSDRDVSGFTAGSVGRF